MFATLWQLSNRSRCSSNPAAGNKASNVSVHANELGTDKLQVVPYSSLLFQKIQECSNAAKCVHSMFQMHYGSCRFEYFNFYALVMPAFIAGAVI